MKTILSLFDGISCGQVALERAGIKVGKYYASEVDKYAMQVAQKNYPDTVQVGDITKLKGSDFQNIDLIIGGSPCQGFSFAGKQLNFNDPRSKLFFEYVRLLKEVNPKHFLLENVKMKKEYQDIISEYIGVQPILINSALVSAQNRQRLYWTNIPIVGQPEDKHIYLKDILHENTEEFIKISKTGVYKKFQSKASCLTAGAHSGGMDLIGTAIDINGNDFLKRIYSKYGKSPTLTAVCGGNQERKIALNDYQYRRFTPIEYERLQTLPDNYTEGISNSQRYKCLGNGWTVNVITWILSHSKELYKAS